MANKQITTLEEAAQALQELTPEDLLAMMRYQEASEQSLPEAPASMNFRAVSKQGFEFLITLRDWDENRLLDRVLSFGGTLSDKASIVPSSGGGYKKAAQPVSTGEVRLTTEGVDPSIIEGPNIIMYQVETLVHKIGKRGAYFKAKGGQWKQWGWNAFQDVFPKDVNFGTALQQDQEITDIPSQLKYAYVDKDKKRVVAFAASV